MVATLRLFLLLWLPGLVVLLGGTGAVLTTGQVDPRDWMVLALVLFALTGWLAGRDRMRALLIAGVVLTVPLFCWLAAGRAPSVGPVASLLAVAALATVMGMTARSVLRRKREPRVEHRFPRSGILSSQEHAGFWMLGAALIVALILWGSRPQPVAPASSRPGLAILSALPLFWREGEAGPQAREDAPIVTLLRRSFTVRPIDSPTDPILSRIDRLLIAQPRVLAPRELVAIDDWVRSGGKAVVLADPLLRWPSPLPIGDRRRAPPVTLLGPLLSHWGVTPVHAAQLGERRMAMDDGALLTLLAFSTMSASASCTPMARGVAVRCAIGRGEAVVVADADLIDDRLWLADPARPQDPRAWTADTPAILTAWLGGDLSAGARRWVVDGAYLRRALFWSFLAGLGWAGMGTALLMRRNQRLTERPG